MGALISLFMSGTVIWSHNVEVRSPKFCQLLDDVTSLYGPVPYVATSPNCANYKASKIRVHNGGGHTYLSLITNADTLPTEAVKSICQSRLLRRYNYTQ